MEQLIIKSRASNMHGANNTYYDITSTTYQYFDYDLAKAGQDRDTIGTVLIILEQVPLQFDFKETKTWKGGFYVGKINTYGDISQYRVEYMHRQQHLVWLGYDQSYSI